MPFHDESTVEPVGDHFWDTVDADPHLAHQRTYDPLLHKSNQRAPMRTSPKHKCSNE